MVQINFAQKQVNAKVVYYGPGMSGKTTNLEIVHQRAPEPNRGELTSISTDGDRTLFFDFMPLDLGTVAGMRTCFQIYTVPGQVYYNSTRKLVLQGVDGVVFVADSSAAMMEENLESLRDLEENLAEYGKDITQLPVVIQYNKRDLPDAMSVDQLNAKLNPANWPYYEAIANTGKGVFPTLKALAAQVLDGIHKSYGSASARPAAAPADPAVGAVGAMGPGTGFFPAPAAGAPAPPPAAGVQPHPMQAPQVHAPAAAVPLPSPAPAAVDAMARTTIHPPPSGQPGEGGGLRMADGSAPPPMPQAPTMAPRTMAQPGGMPQAPPPSAGLAVQEQPMQQHAAHQQPATAGGPMTRMMGVEPGTQPPAPASTPRSFPAPTPARRAQEAPRFKPRQSTRTAPAKGRNAVLTGVFVVGALAVGALLGSFVLSII